jgi:glutamate formiminotransferase/formiminotetrahydrofolate cyclodeaminase
LVSLKELMLEKQARTAAIENATKYACEVPLRTMKLCLRLTHDMLGAMIEKGNQNSVTDAGVGVLCMKTAVRGAYFNVLVNAKSLKDQALRRANHQRCQNNSGR